MNSSTLYPISWFTSFQTNEAESEPIHTAACVAANVDPDDEEVATVEVDRDEAIEAIEGAQNRCPSFDEISDQVWADRFFVVSGLDCGYCRLIHFPAGALETPPHAAPNRV